MKAQNSSKSVDTGNFYGLLTKMRYSLKNVLPKSARLDLNLPPRNGSLRSKSRGQNTKKVANPLRISDLKMIGRGERGIRTPGASQHAGFQDRCNRPLYHLSEKALFPNAVQRYNKKRKVKRQMRKIICSLSIFLFFGPFSLLFYA